MVDKSEKFTSLVRLGFAARGVVYGLIGYLALTAAGGEKGPEGAFNWIQDAPFGEPVLYAAAVGLAAYAVFRLCSLLFDIENHGTDAKGMLHRIGHGASALAHFALAWTAFRFAHGDKQTATGGNAEEAAGTLLSFGFGPVLLGLLGVGFLVVAFLQGKSAVTASFMHRVAGNAPALVEPIGRAGHAARAAVFVIIGWSLIQSGWLASENRIKTLGDAVNSLAGSGIWYTLVAAGLLMFGVFSLFVAYYRIVPDISRQDLRPTFR